jgi:hypothetical protein
MLHKHDPGPRVVFVDLLHRGIRSYHRLDTSGHRVRIEATVRSNTTIDMADGCPR